MKLLYPLLGLTLLLASVVQAGSITTIQLLICPAGEIISIIKPMLGAGDISYSTHNASGYISATSTRERSQTTRFTSFGSAKVPKVT